MKRTTFPATLSAIFLVMVAISVFSAAVAQDAPARSGNSSQRNIYIAKDGALALERMSNYERFAERDGSLILTAYYKLTAPRAKSSGTKTELVHAIDVASGDVVFALRFTSERSRGGHPRNRATLDRDEIDALGKAVAYVEANIKTIVARSTAHTEFKYRSRGGFKFGFFSTPGANVPGANTQVFVSLHGNMVLLTSLADVKDLVVEAQAKIRKIETPDEG